MDFEGLKLSERSRAEKDKHYVIHMYNLKKKKIKPVNKTKKKQTHRYREQMSGYQQGEGRGDGQDIGD